VIVIPGWDSRDVMGMVEEEKGGGGWSDTASLGLREHGVLFLIVPCLFLTQSPITTPSHCQVARVVRKEVKKAGRIFVGPPPTFFLACLG
jgi:hypothetical protein